MNTFGQLSHAVSTQMNQVDTMNMAQNMQMFNDKMDETLINNKMMTEMMSNNDVAVDTNADQMLDVLKQEVAMEEQNKMEIKMEDNKNINYNQQKQEQQYQPQGNQNNGMQMGGQGGQGGDADDPFLNQLKGL